MWVWKIYKMPKVYHLKLLSVSSCTQNQSNVFTVRIFVKLVKLEETYRLVVINLTDLRYGKLEENWQRCVCCNCGFNQNELRDCPLTHDPPSKIVGC